MNKGFVETLCEERDNLLNMKQSINETMRQLPGGKLRVTTNKGRYLQFFWLKPQERKAHPNGIYIRSEERAFVQKLAQQEYFSKVMERIGRRLADLDKTIQTYENTSLEECFLQLDERIQPFVEPVELSDEEYARRWLDAQEHGMNTHEFDKKFFTERGECVRSKSEKIIADKLYAMEIPYVYEPGFTLWTGVKVYPDFKVLNVRTRKAYYLEHFGMMDNPKYSSHATQKLEDYQRSGLWPGKNLLFLTETAERPLSVKTLDALIQEFLV